MKSSNLLQRLIFSKTIIAVWLFVTASIAQAQTDLIITGVIDGPLSGGLPKAVELFVLNDIADLSIYALGSANNGGGTDGEEFTFPAVTATAGSFIYVATEATGFTTWFGFAPDYTGSVANINGDDAIELFQNGSVVDVFGEIDVDGTGQPWEYMDGWAYRVDGTGPDGSTFVLANWSFSGANALDGESTNATAATPFPTGTYQPPVVSHSFTVINTNDSGMGSLRQAILDANALANLDASTPDTIKFDIPGAGPHTISPTSELPAIEDAVIIDGTTQPGADCSSWPPTLLIELDGSNAGSVDGITLFPGSDGSLIRGLIVNRFLTGIVPASTNNRFECNFVGTDVTGTIARPNTASGFEFRGPATGNTVGGSSSDRRNLISGNASAGILFDGSGFNTVQGNYIGTDVSGSLPLGNQREGVATINPGQRIGGIGGGEGNIIAFNGAEGVLILANVNNTILSNSIHSNGALGIDLAGDGVTMNDLVPGDGDTGPNNLQNFPDIISATTTGSSITIAGSFNSTPDTDNFRLEFFANAVCNGDQNGDPQADDYGEGETFLGFTTVSTDGSGDASFSVNLSVTVSAGAFITATATAPDPGNSTSEFSQCVEAVAASAVKPYVIVANSNVKFDGTERSDGDIHSNGDITFHDEEKGTHTGNLSARGDITIDKDVTIDGDAIAGDEVYEFGKITGSKAEHENVDIIPLPTLNFSAGGPDKTAPKKGSLTLSPGTYGKVKVEKKATLFLSSGDYFMDELDTDNLATVVIDVSAGPVNINVVKDLEIDDRVEIVIVPNGESDSELVTFSSMQKNKIDIGKYSRVLGTIIAPKAEVHFSDGSAFKGAICADKVTVEEEVPFFHHDSPHSLPKASDQYFVNSDQFSEAGIQESVDSFELSQNYPNPFNPSTMINYQLPMSSVVKLSIYNLQGQLVRTLVSGEMPAGSHSVTWNATDDSGARVASGVYLYVIRADAFISQRKLVLMK